MAADTAFAGTSIQYSTNAQKLFHVAGTEDIFRRQRRKQRGRQLAHLSEEMRALLRRMLNLDPYRRPSVAKLLQDDAFADFSAILEVPRRTPPVTKTHLMVKIELKVGVAWCHALIQKFAEYGCD